MYIDDLQRRLLTCTSLAAVATMHCLPEQLLKRLKRHMIQRIKHTAALHDLEELRAVRGDRKVRRSLLLEVLAQVLRLFQYRLVALDVLLAVEQRVEHRAFRQQRHRQVQCLRQDDFL